MPSAAVHPNVAPVSAGTIVVSIGTDGHPTPSVSTVNVPHAPPTAIVSPVSVTKVVVSIGLAAQSTSVSHHQSLGAAAVLRRTNVPLAHDHRSAKRVNAGVVNVCMTHRNP